MSWQDQGGSDDKGSKRRNPWGQPENRPNSPWGNQRPGPDNDGSPDMDEIVRKIKESFGGKFPSDGNPIKLGLLIVAVVAAIWFASGFYLIQPSEHGVVTTFGKYSRTETTSGLKYRLPYPIQNTIIVPVTVERRIQIGFSDGPVRRGANQDNSDESLMLTGDENIVDIDYVVLWRISDAKDYLFSIRDTEDTIKLVSESAMREIIGQTKIQSALTEARGQIQDDTRKLMQSILDEYKAGVLVNNVQLQKVDPPGDVVDAFNEVQRARQEKERLRNEAEAYRNDIIPRAKGEGEKLRQQAEGYQQEVVNRAKGDADRFNQVYAAYRNGKTVTAERMYLETIEQILQNAKIVYMGSEKGSNVLPYLPLNDLKRTQTAKPSGGLNEVAPAAGQ